jgi:hypothetical protein
MDRHGDADVVYADLILDADYDMNVLFSHFQWMGPSSADNPR